MNTPTKTYATAFAISVALITAGCAGNQGGGAQGAHEVFLQPVAEAGPDPFTPSTGRTGKGPAPIAHMAQPPSGGYGASVI